jgi:hypothetical protein
MSSNIFPCHLKFATWKQIYQEYSMIWYGIFLKILSYSSEQVHLLVWAYLPTHPLMLLLRKKSRTTFGSLVVDLKEDEEWTCSDEIGVGGGEKLYATTTQGSIKEKPKPNLDYVIDNIQVEPIVFTEPMVPITKPTQCVVVAT